MLKTVACWLIRVYQVVWSSYRLPVCRFYPSCSELTKTSMASCGFFKGGYIGFKQLIRCHPFSMARRKGV